MRIRIQKRGNSLAIRIPRAFAQETGLRDGSPASLTISGGRLVICPITEEPLSLEQLLARITEENIHPAVDMDTGTGWN